MTNLKKCLVSFFLILLYPLMSSAQNNPGWSAYHREDYVTAYQEFLPLAQRGDVGAQRILGELFRDGKGVSQDYLEAIKWYRQAAENGDPWSQIALGYMYWNGRGVLQSYSEALWWFQRAAEQGNTDAQNLLGDMYYLGDHVPQNYSEAFKWYRYAALAGSTRAQVKVGKMYWRGEGVSQDYSEAMRYFRDAADSGNNLGMILVGLMYENAAGVSQDFERAYAWYDAAVRHRGGEDARRHRVSVTGKMTLDQLSRAKEFSERLAVYLEKTRRGVAAVEPTLEPPPSPQKAPSPRLPDASSELIAKVQKHLKSLEYDPGPIDGIQGERTTAAVTAFQREFDLEPTGVISHELLKLIEEALAAKSEPPPAEPEKQLELSSSGTGFVVNTRGYALTNYHVIEGCESVTVPIGDELHQAEIAQTDPQNDLALIKISAPSSVSAIFRKSRRVNLGEPVYVSGYPLRSMLADDMNFTNGTVSAIAGIENDARLIQITAPVQKGNSGGPVLDQNGNVMGVVVSKLNAIRVFEHYGDVPQNINFAIKGVIAQGFLDIHGIEYQIAQSTEPFEPTAIAAKARQFTFVVECWQ